MFMKILGRIGNGLALFWVIWVILVYFLFHPGNMNALLASPYKGAILLLILVTIGGHILVFKRSAQLTWRGLYWPLYMLAFSVILIPTFYGVTDVESPGIGGQIIYFCLFSIVLIMVLFIMLLSAWSLGRFIWDNLIQHEQLSGKGLVALGIGLSLQTFLITIFALTGAYYRLTIVALILVSLALSYKEILPMARRVIWQKKIVSLTKWWQLPVSLIFFSALTIAWISAIKPYPLGNDGASLYLALSHKLASSLTLPSGGQSFAWSVYMSIGELIGQKEVFSVMLSHVMGFLSAAALYHLLLRWLEKPYALLGTVLLFISPYFAFHSIIDEKVDLALLFFSLLIVHLTFVLRNEECNQKERYRLIILIGWLCGFAFAIKYSFMLVLIPVLALTISSSLKQSAGLFYILIGLLFAVGAPRYIGLEMSSVERILTILGFTAIGGGIILAAKNKLSGLPRSATLALIFIFVSIIPFSPWMIKHATEHETISLGNLLQGVEERPLFITDPDLFGYESPALFNQSPILEAEAAFMQDRTTGLSIETNSQSKYEELQRYLGFEDGLWRYLSLPFDITYSINIVGNRYVQIGFLFLGLLPLFLVSKGRWWRNSAIALSALFWVSLSLVSVNDYQESSRNADSILLAGDLIERQPSAYRPLAETTYDLLVDPLYQTGRMLSPVYESGSAMSQPWSGLALGILFFLVGLVARNSFGSLSINHKSFILFVGMLMLSWWLLGMGVVWYGMLFFALAPAIIILAIAQPGSQSSWIQTAWVQRIFTTAIFLQLAFHFLLYFTNPRVGGQPENLFNWPNLSYATQSDFTKEDVIDAYNPFHDEVIEKLNTDRDAKIYDVNSVLKYHIFDYEDRVFEDNLLTWFRDERNKYGDRLDYAQALEANGYKYVLFNLNTLSLDKTPEQLLANRCRDFLRMIVNSEKFEIAVTDNYVYDPSAPQVNLPGGTTTTASQGLVGRIVYQGSFALFELK